jgi:hypothetical protein
VCAMEEKRERKEKKRSKKRRRDESVGRGPERQLISEGEQRQESEKEKTRKTNFHKRSLIGEIEKFETKSEPHPIPESISSAETKDADEPAVAPAALTQIAATSKSDFFSKLLAKEKRAPPVGTFHATGKKSDSQGSGSDSSTDWLCPKCNTSNYSHSHQCQKCKAVKRMTVWR